MVYGVGRIADAIMVVISAFVVAPVVALVAVIPEVWIASRGNINAFIIVDKVVSINIVVVNVIPDKSNYSGSEGDAVGVVFKLVSVDNVVETTV